GDCGTDVADDPHVGTVVGDAGGEQVHALRARERTGTAIAALDRFRQCAVDGADPREDLVARGRQRPAHHSRKVWRATGLRSRLDVHAASGPGSRVIFPARTNGRCTRRPTRCASANRRAPPNTHAIPRMTSVSRLWGTRLRRCSRTCGMSILTGHTS